MRCASAVSECAAANEAAAELIERVRPALDESRADLCLLLASAHFEDGFQAVCEKIEESLTPRAFIGATGAGVMGGDTEYEQQTAIVLFVARLPGAKLVSFHLSTDDLGRFDSAEALREHLGVPASARPSFLLLGDPYSINPLDVLRRLHEAYPGRPAFGGMASAGEAPGQNALVFDGHVLRHGISGVALWGDVEIETIVSQGCRPIGRHMVITRAERNIIHSLGGRPPLGVVRELLNECSEEDREVAAARGLCVGCVVNEHQAKFGSGDFLIRNALKFDRDSGTLAIDDLVRTGQTIQFHVRDAESAAEDLRRLLQLRPPRPAAGALLFSCNRRGRRLFPDRHHDARTIARACGGPALAGIFCTGEIGPVGNRNFLHDYTASIALFRPAGE